jgi:hypothetical protein
LRRLVGIKKEREIVSKTAKNYLQPAILRRAETKGVAQPYIMKRVKRPVPPGTRNLGTRENTEREERMNEKEREGERRREREKKGEEGHKVRITHACSQNAALVLIASSYRSVA